MNATSEGGPGAEDARDGVVKIPKVNSWSDVVALTTLLSLFFAGVVWGMKLEGRYDKLDAKVDRTKAETLQGFDLLRHDISEVAADVAEVKNMIQKGILPVTEERTNALDERVRKLEGKKHVDD